MTVMEHRLKIERVVERGKSGAMAQFNCQGRLCCTAHIWPDGSVRIHGGQVVMTVEQASTVSIALQMACEWCTEELAKR